MTAPPRTTIAVGYYTRYYSREADLRTPRLRTTNPLNKLAERAGFEPAVPLRVHMISNHAPSATRSPLPLGRARIPRRPGQSKPATRSAVAKVQLHQKSK